MDLLASVRKEGSRGGRAEFKWDDVANSSHRENYLGHSLMAPVGRWQKNKDLSWYAKGDKSEAAAEARREEIRKVKEAEQDALSEALGFGPAPKRNVEGANANEVPLGKRDVERAVRETQEDGEGLGEAGRGVGFGAFEGPRVGDAKDVLQGAGDTTGTPEERALRRIIAEEKAKKRMRRRGGTGGMKMIKGERGGGIIVTIVKEIKEAINQESVPGVRRGKDTGTDIVTIDIGRGVTKGNGAATVIQKEATLGTGILDTEDKQLRL